MISINTMPATTGNRAFGTPVNGTWLTCTTASAGSYPGVLIAPNHLQFAAAAPASAAVSARPVVGNAGADAARKRGRPPRGEPR